MFWFLCIISTVAYSLQYVLMTRYVREMDAWSAAMYRTLSLGISMLPLLLFAGWNETKGIVSVWPQVWLASLFGAGGLAMFFAILQYLPIGITGTISTAIRTILMLIIAWLFLDESLTPTALLLVTIILGATIWLGLIRQKQTDTNLKSFEFSKGVFFVSIQCALVAIALILFADAAREHNALVVSYFWEAQIGILLILLGLGRWIFFKKPLDRISLATFWKILLVSSPTLVGTGAFALAVNEGPVGIVGVISVIGILLNAVLAYFWYHEKPLRIEWLGMGLIALGIMGLRLVQL